MHNLLRVGFALSFLHAATFVCSAQDVVTLKTTDTAIQLRAGESAPQLLFSSEIILLERIDDEGVALKRQAATKTGTVQ
jgi:hypothetical protein